VRKLILSIIGHGLWGKKIKPVSRSCGNFKPKNNRFSQRINPQEKIITLGDLNDGAYNKSVKVALGAKAKKADVPKLESTTIRGYGQKRFWNHCLRDAWDIFDQIMVSKPLQPDYSSYRFWKAGIYNKSF
jgi:hypothetical protein